MQGIYRARQRKRMLYIYIAWLFLLSAVIPVMPIAVEMKENSLMILYIVGGIFWIGLIGTVVQAIMINKNRKRSKQFSQFVPVQKQFGLIHFFQNKPAIIFDILLFASVLGLLAVNLLNVVNLIQFILIAVFIFSFGMHCMLNGINYKYINYRVRRVKEHE